MDTPEATNEGCGAVLADVTTTTPPRSIWGQPLGRLALTVIENQDELKRFLSLTGGSVLYCLSALSITGPARGPRFDRDLATRHRRRHLSRIARGRLSHR